MNYPFTLTQMSARAYPLAKKLGFVCKFAVVYFMDNWRYCIGVRDFDLSEFQISGPTKFDAPDVPAEMQKMDSQLRDA